MKIDRNKDTKFKPITLNITLESLREVRGFFAMFNAFALEDVLGITHNEAGRLRDQITEHIPDAYNEIEHTIIINDLKKFFNK